MSIRNIRETRNRFLALNRARLQRARMSLGAKKRDVLDLVPFLFHINSPVLPGFVSRLTPRGISDYSPGRRTLLAAKRFSKSFRYQRRALPNYDILALYIIGSAGSIAYTDTSDVDVWICMRPDLDKTARFRELESKARAIEQWARKSGLKLHFFLMDVDKFVRGMQHSVTAEGSGSAQYMLLLEEFYRTGLLLAGRYPLWWLVPPEQEQDYETVTGELLRKRFVRTNECIDFGSITSIPVGEFFGAALWQLNKAIDCPYKAVLKMALMETYAREYPATDLLSHRYKQLVYDGENDLNRLDAYRMMYEKLEAHLMEYRQEQRLEMLRRCFFFKVDEPLAAVDRHPANSWRRQLIDDLARDWKWSDRQLEDLRQRRFWKIDRVGSEYQELVRELTGTYRFLSQFARQSGQLATIRTDDLNTLGRRLFAVYERKAGKVEIISRGISSNLGEKRLTVRQSTDDRGAEVWELYRDVTEDLESPDSVCLRRSTSLVALIAWCHFNGLVNGTTAYQLKVRRGGLTLRELRALTHSMCLSFPRSLVLEGDIENYKSTPVVLNSTIFANVGIDPMYVHRRGDRHLTSARTDALSYSGLHENLAVTLDMLQLNSWKEVTLYHYTGIQGVLDCLRDYMRSIPPLQTASPPVRVQCFSSSRGTAIAQRIQELFDDVIACYSSRGNEENARYLVEVDQSYALLSFFNGVLQYQWITTLDDLFNELRKGHAGFSSVIVDRYALRETPLPWIYADNREYAVQLFFSIDGEWVDVYVLDELGSLFYERIPYYDTDVLLSHYANFLGAVIFRRQIQNEGSVSDSLKSISLECYEIHRSPSGGWRVTGREPPARHASLPGQIGLQVIGNRHTHDELSFSIFYNGEQITNANYGEDVFRDAARYILKSRKSRIAYPIRITDIDLPPPGPVGGDREKWSGSMQTVDLLAAKKELEERFNMALSTLQPQLDDTASRRI